MDLSKEHAGAPIAARVVKELQLYGYGYGYGCSLASLENARFSLHEEYMYGGGSLREFFGENKDPN